MCANRCLILLLSSSISLSTILGASSTARADVLTAAALLAAGEAAKGALGGMTKDLDATAQASVAGAQNALSAAMDRFRSIVGTDLQKQVDQLSETARNLGNIIKLAVEQINDLVTRQVQCASRDMEYLVAALKTVAAQLGNSIPFGQKSGPFVYAFAIDGHTRGVVPKTGGLAVIYGFRLWNRGLGPRVDLVDKERNVVQSLVVGRSNGDDEASALLPGAALSGHAGECLEFRVTPRRKKLLGGASDMPPLFLPICVPGVFEAKYRFRVVGEANVRLADIGDHISEKPLEDHIFYCENRSCDSEQVCSDTYRWTIPEGCSVIGLKKVPGDLRWNDARISITEDGGKVSISGSLDRATCYLSRLTHASVWQYVVAPIVHCSGPREWWKTFSMADYFSVNSTKNPPVCHKYVKVWGDVTPPERNVVLDPRNETYYIELYRQSAGRDVLLGQSIPVHLGKEAGDAPSVLAVDGLRVQAHFDPNVACGSGKLTCIQACATIDASQCGY